MGSIQPIDKASVHRIASGQVIVDLPSAVKEIVENSIDAGATSIEVRFKDYGVKSIEVVDNGTGISPKDYNALGLKHCTSKLSRYEDLSTIGSFGFRGEALSSLCAVCDSVVITTATSAEAPIGTTLELERDGTLRSSEVKIARQRGTTVTASGLFVPLPVRRAELTRNVKREFAKALNLLHSYALLPCVVENDGIRLSVSNQSEGGKKVVQFRTSGSPDLNSGVSSLWGPKCLTELVPVNLNFIIEPEKSLLKQTDNKEIEVSVNGLISKFSHGSGRATSDRQFFYINNRPTNSPKVQKVFNEVYHSFNINQYPFVLANISLPTNSYDVNVSPDKRTIFLHRESTLLTSIKVLIHEMISYSDPEPCPH
ncbi:histidine kinase-like ATPase [Cantharellus anzutake]|uniref:histidine kinase-like ATPase n=1 Tax=Cantharellus anzutake TaxID=1750568 RepID=UPI001907B20C|nr:histidine kinase-like ATPase [Cantharellus anzutake]KAF8340350.1 histidine kinase-like ATPase [Cantharellus anzutake]